jgi:hypothetical protein
MRALVIGAMVATLVGCGSEASPKPAVQQSEAAPKKPAAEVIYLYRVQGDDPMPYSVSLRADGTAQVIRGGGHGGFKKIAVVLDPADAKRSARLAERAPFKRLDGLTVRPGGFGGWDNDIRYMIRRGNRSVTVTADHMPRSIRPLVRNLDAIIDGDTGREVSSSFHAAISGTIDN